MATKKDAGKKEAPMPWVCNRCDFYEHGTCRELRSKRYSTYPDEVGCAVFVPVRFFGGEPGDDRS